jgi:hypothetical protein
MRVMDPWSKESNIWMIGIQQMWVGENKVHEVDVASTVTSNRNMRDFQMRQKLGGHFCNNESANFVEGHC